MTRCDPDARPVTTSPLSTLLTALFTALTVSVWGCSEATPEAPVTLPDPIDVSGVDLDGVTVAPTDGLDGPTHPDCDPSALRVIDVRPWTGGGLQVTLELLEQGAPMADPEGVSVAQVKDDGDLNAVSVGVGKVGHGITTLLLVPSEDSDAHQATLQTAHDLVDALGSSERIALRVADEARTLMADLTTRRPHLHRRIDELSPRPFAEPLEALSSSRAELSGVGGPFGPLSREVILVDGETSGATLAAELHARRAATLLVGL
jgi:hypothetical protein